MHRRSKIPANITPAYTKRTRQMIENKRYGQPERTQAVALGPQILGSNRPKRTIHTLTPCFVKPLVRISLVWLGLLALPAIAADTSLDALLKGVENRYNHIKSLQVFFNETYTVTGQARKTESGVLMLSKPGRMRWEYSEPKGKLFISDGKLLWLYTPSDNRAEKMSLKETGDMRAPLAFLLGKLNFQKEFRNLTASAAEGGTRIAAEPATGDLPYTAVEFLVAPGFSIKEVTVTGYDRSILHFVFDNEKLDPPFDGKLFRFQAPPGTEIVDSEP
jgi:outer membrane lipoprotein carrier protein